MEDIKKNKDRIENLMLKNQQIIWKKHRKDMRNKWIENSNGEEWFKKLIIENKNIEEGYKDIIDIKNIEKKKRSEING
ncbi:surface-associated interspersed protein (SURFIN), fragment [Plasmodium gallinaceum]|uniref:Surface-associated interspersed protein (SURFIN) n=1 Tax=Plasmodium gallinaceum TaxID=5849 RepID=A0A1J1H0A5_PLAGA|nr:surface-associated interspersed protein (SURFIN), fragment [Plasmodium gallinaceum]CRG97995.1 surface-associated interspersed protein (SURFIN), fragment [Plasmodium gallinaceum]